MFPVIPAIPPTNRPLSSGRGDQMTMLDALNHRQRDQLSEGARRALSMMQFIVTPMAQDVSGFYQSRGYSGTSPGTANLNTAHQGTNFGSMVNLHEGLHGFDAMNRRAPSSRLRGNTRSSESKRQYLRYHGRPMPKRATSYYTSGQGDDLSSAESYATMGMNGPEAVPINMLNMFADVFSKDAIRKAKWSYSHGG